MTDVSLEALNRRTTAAAVRAEAARIGADGDALLDSSEFYSRVTALDPDAAAYGRQVREAVANAAGKSAPASAPAAAPATAPQAVRQPAAGPKTQWTMDQIKQASGAEILTAMDSGLLTDLGYAPRRRRR